MVARAAVVIAGAAIGVAAEQSAPGPAAVAHAASLGGFVRVAHGARRGAILAGPVPGVGLTALYVPWRAREGHDLPVVYVLCKRDASSFARASGLALTGDQLVWDGTTPPFVVVVAHASSAARLERLVAWTQAVLPVSGNRAGRTLAGVGADARSAVRIATGDPDLVGLTESADKRSREARGRLVAARRPRPVPRRAVAGRRPRLRPAIAERAEREPSRARRGPGGLRRPAHRARRRDDLAGPDPR